MAHSLTYILRFSWWWFALTMTLSAKAQIGPEWTTNHAPFRLVGNLYYVGSNDLAAYLLVTPEGHILLNGNLTSSVAQIQQNIEALGFRLQDVKVLLNSQAHFDHVGGLAELKRRSGAKLAAMAPDVAALESGGRTDFFYYNDSSAHFPAVHVDRVLHEGDHVKLGGAVFTAHLTAGHTPGDTTWTLDVPADGKVYQVLIFGGASVNPGNNLLSDPRYPHQADDLVRTFQTAPALPCTIFLGAHGIYFNLAAKYARLQAGESSPFVDPAGYQAYLRDREQAFQAELTRQQAAAKAGQPGSNK